MPLALALAAPACGQQEDSAPGTTATATSPAVAAAALAGAPAPAEEPADALPTESLKVLRARTGDLPAMLERNVIRALVPWSDSYYYLDGAQQRGIAYEAIQIFQKWLNGELQSGARAVQIVVVPVRRDMLFQLLVDGYGDFAVGGITITEERRAQVDFTDPASKPVRELVVAAPSAPRLAGLDDLSGRSVHVRRSSSYWDSLEGLNESLQSRGLDPVVLVAADEYLSTEDLMQMAHAGLIPYTIADHHLAQYWAQALPGIRVRDDLAVREGARMGWAIRKNSPELMALLNRFLTDHRQGTLIGNVVINRYLKDPRRLHNVNSKEDQERLEAVYNYFATHAAEHDFDILMLVAQGFQESRLDQSRRSHRGAVGVMQLLPSTAADPVVGVDDISTPGNNIMAGIRYMAWIRDTYLDDLERDPFNQTLFAFASYNAGPARTKSLRAKAAERGLDPDVWFENVELIAAEDIGRETVEYVSNIYKYYVAYKLLDVYRPKP